MSYSRAYKVPVTEIPGQRVGATVALALTSLIFARGITMSDLHIRLEDNP